MHRNLPVSKSRFCESKIVRRDNGRYIAVLTLEFSEPPVRSCSSILAVDLGECFAATAVLLQDRNVVKARFYGRDKRDQKALRMAPQETSRKKPH